MTKAKYTISREPYTLDIYRLQKVCLPGDSPVAEDEKHLYWVARTEDGEAVAFIIMDDWKTYWYLLRAGTVAKHGRNGLYPRLLRAAFKYIRTSHAKDIYTDCAYWNTNSANGLFKAGFKLYTPAYKWGFNDGLYWYIKL